MRLTDFAYDQHSQFGEDGMIDHLFMMLDNPPPPPPPEQPEGTADTLMRLPPPAPVIMGTRICVEFGASDDLDCSNVANLWEQEGWKAFLLEADPKRAETLATKVNDRCEVLCRHVKPTGPDSIDEILAGIHVDFMSIDVDGNDYHIWRRMQSTTPRVICIEFNPTIPPHISLHQEYDQRPMGFGASLKALIDLGLQKGYTFVGATEINAFFVRDRFFPPFGTYERDPMELFPLTNYTFLVSDFLGAAVATGAEQPWGIHLPYEGPTLAGEFMSITESPKQTMDAYEAKYGRIVRWPHKDQPNIANPDFTGPIPGGDMLPISARNLLRKYVEDGQSPICIAIAHIAIEQALWVYTTAAEHGYHCQTGGGVLALIRSQP